MSMIDRRRRSSSSAGGPSTTARSPSALVVKRTWAIALLEEGGDVELVVGLQVEVVGATEQLVVALAGIGPLRALALAVPPIEAGGDDRDAHFVAHVVVDHRAED